MTRDCLVVCAALLLMLISLTESATSRLKNGEIPQRAIGLNGIRSETKIPHLHRQKSQNHRKHSKPLVNMSSSKDSDDSSPIAKKPKLTSRDKMIKGDKSTLLLVNVMFRHGDRAPEPAELSSFPNYEYVNDTWHPIGAGHLTNNGKRRLYKLGKTVRARYGKFLGDFYNTDITTTFSTDLTRTKASALMFHAGLWPPNRQQVWSDEEGVADLWQPITYITDPKINSAMNIFLVSPCYHEEFTKVISRPEFQQRLFPREKLLNYLSENIGSKISHPIQVWMLQSLFKAAEAMGKDKPKWAVDVWDEMQDVSNLAFEVMFANDDLKRMAIGPVLKRILDDCKAKAEEQLEPKGRKLVVYSGHDTTVAPLFAALGGPDGYIDEEGNPLKSFVPTFGSAVILELHRLKDGEHAVKVLYNEGTQDGSFKPLRLSGYGEFCPLEKYLELTKQVALEDQGLEACKKPKLTRTMVDYLNPLLNPNKAIPVLKKS